MRFWIQYHSYDNLGYLPGGYETKATDLSALDTSDYESSGITTSKRVICDAVGDVVFFIVGYGGKSKKYLLWSWCMVEDVEQRDDDRFNAFGTGRVLNPPPLLAGPEFDEFKKWNANFSLGFRDISKVSFLNRLLTLARERGRFDLSESYSEALDAIPQEIHQPGGLTEGAVQLTTPQAEDLEPPAAERVETTVSRILRDTRLSNRVKALHNYECQLCGSTLLLADGSRYAEGHHILPLGSPHNGPDVLDNIICLCPNHHAACDLGAIVLVTNELRGAAGHVVAQQYIDYHNSSIYRGSNRAEQVAAANRPRE